MSADRSADLRQLELDLQKRGVRPELFTSNELDRLLEAGYVDWDELRGATRESLLALNLRYARVDSILAAQGEDAWDFRQGLGWANWGKVTSALGACFVWKHLLSFSSCGWVLEYCWGARFACDSPGRMKVPMVVLACAPAHPQRIRRNPTQTYMFPLTQAGSGSAGSGTMRSGPSLRYVGRALIGAPATGLCLAVTQVRHGTVFNGLC